jgi:ATP-dependent Zn protease
VKIEKGSLNSIDMARLSVGFSGADLSNLVNIAVLNAVKNKRKAANN